MKSLENRVVTGRHAKDYERKMRVAGVRSMSEPGWDRVGPC